MMHADRALDRIDAGPRSSLPAGRAVPAADYWGVRITAVSILIWLISAAIGFEAGLTALTVLGFVAAIIGVYRPVLGAIGIALLCTLDAPSRVLLLTGGILRWNTFNYWLLISLALNAGLVLRMRGLSLRLVQCLALLLVLQLFMSPAVENGVQNVLPLVTAMALMAYAWRIAHNREAWFWAAVVSGMVAAVGTPIFYLQRSQLPYVNPNAYAYFPLTAVFSAMLAFAAGAATGRRQTFLAALSALNLAWVFLTGSRGGLAVGLCCVLFLFLSMRGVGRRMTALAAIATAALVVSLEFSELEFASSHRFSKMADNTETMSARTSGRSELGAAGWYIFKEHPLGIGTGGFSAAWAEVSRRGDVPGLSGWHRGVETQAHSAWIKTLAENGIIGGLLLAGFVASFAICGLRQRDRLRRRFGLMVSVVIAVAFLSTEFQNKGIWLLASGAVAVLGPAVPRRGGTVGRARR